MTGLIIRRGDRVWLIRVFLGREGETGKRRYLNRTVHGTKKEAQQVLTGILRDRDTGTFVEPTRITLNEYLDRWLATSASQRVHLRTFQGYCEFLDRYVRPAIGRRRQGCQPRGLTELSHDATNMYPGGKSRFFGRRRATAQTDFGPLEGAARLRPTRKHPIELSEET